jgi:hypothetical protein
MSASPVKYQLTVVDLIEQEPVWFDVAIPNAFPIACQNVWFELGRKRTGLGKYFDHVSQFVQIAATLLLPLHIFSKPAGFNDIAHCSAGEQ